MARRGWVAALAFAVLVGLCPAGVPRPVAAAEPDEHFQPPTLPSGDGQPVDPTPDIPPPPGVGAAWPGAATCKHAKGRVLVKFKKPGRGRAAAYAALNGRRIRGFATVPGLEVVSTKFDVREAAKKLRTDPGVEFVEPDCTLSLEATPNDPDLDQLWGLVNTGQDGGTPGADIGAAEGWDVRTDASAVTVAVIDSGIQRAHPDLIQNAWTNLDETAGNGIDDDGNGYVDDRIGWDWVNQEANPDDDNGHGTHVAGTIGARGNNSIGVTGVAWQVKLMALKAMDSTGTGYISNVVAAVDYAAANGAKVINASFGSTEFSRSLYDAFRAAGQQGVLTVAAAGNSNENSDEFPHYPASFRLDTMISVAATTRLDELAGFSNHGIYTVDVAAPGDSILSTLPGSTYGVFSGTSMATPHVAGMAALLAAQNPGWAPVQLRQRIVGTARAVAALDGKAWAGGVVDVGKALSGAATVLPPMPPAPAPVALSPATVATPAPAPLAAPPPPTLPAAEVVESSATDLAEPKIDFDSAGNPHVAYIRRFEGVRIASRVGTTWSDRQVTSAYDDLFYLDVAIGPDDVPQIAVQRAWTSLALYTDPGIILGRAPAGGATVQRLTAACPQAASCYWDWHPSNAIDGANKRHVAFIRTAAWDQDMVKADTGATVPGDGLYYATDATGSLVVQRILPDVTGSPPALAVEPGGTAHLVAGIQDGSASGLYYLTNDGGSWSSLRLTTNVNDSSADIAVDTAGGVHVVYSRLGLGVWYRYRSPAGTWAAEQRILDAATYRASVAVDGAGKVHVAAGVMDGFNTVNGVKWISNQSGSWAANPIGGDLAAYPSIALDPTGKVGVAYLEYSAAPIGIYVALESGGGFITTMIRSFSDEAGGASLAQVVDGNGHSHVILGRGWSGSSPGVYYATNASGAWQLEKVVHGIPNATAIALDASGRPHIAFSQMPQPQVGPAVSTRIGYAVRTAGSWSVKTVSTEAYGDGVAIALDAAGTPNILWPNAAGTRLRHARPSGTGWTIENAYSGPGTQIREMTALIDPAGVVHVAFDAMFAGVEGTRTMYARRSGSTWTSATVAGGGAIHFYPSIARTPSGALWIVDMRFGDSASDGVWAYTSTGGPWTATNLGPDQADTWPSVAVDSAGRVRVAWARGWFYSSSGCSVPMCANGPGLRESVLDGGTWTTTKLTAYWHDIFPRIAAGPGGAVRIVWYRNQVGLRAMTRVAGTDIVPPGATLTPSTTITRGGVSYAVRFTEPITGLTASDFSRTGTATGCVIGTPTGSGMTWAVPVTGCSTGTLILSLGASTVVDAGSKAGPVAAVTAASVIVDRTAPTVTVPTIGPRTNTPLSGTDIPVRVTWTGADVGAGIASYTLERSTDGGATWIPVQDEITTSFFDTAIAASGTVRFRVSAVDKAGNASTFAIGVTRTGRLLQQTSSLVHYSGTWTLASASSYSGGSARYTQTSGRSASLTFSARSIALVTTRATTRGKVRIYIDGVDQGVVDLYRSSTQHRSVVWQKTWTSTLPRTIRIVAVGSTRVDVDAFVLIK